MVFSLQSQPRWLAVDGLQSDASPPAPTIRKKGKELRNGDGDCLLLFHIGSNLQYIFSLSFPQAANPANNKVEGVPYEVEFRRYFENRIGILDRF